MCDQPRPNGESDPCLFHPGRFFDVGWLFGGESVDAAIALVYEVYEPDREHPERAAKHPVYVGVTGRFSSRWTAHRSSSSWMAETDVLCVIVHGYRSRGEARKVEALLIEEHDPPFNTKIERRHLRSARMSPPGDWLYLAELVHIPTRTKEVALAHP